MSTTLTNGLKLPDKGSVDWYADMQNNYQILDGAVGAIAEHSTQIAGKASASHTHGKSDITDLFNSANTWTALNSYNQSIQITANFDIGAAPSSDAYGGFNFGNGTVNIGNVTARVSSAGITYSRLYVSNKYANGALDPNGTLTNVELQVGLKANGNRFIYSNASWDNSLVPYANNTYDLGSSESFGLVSRVWSNSYIQHGYFTGIQQGNEYSTNARTNLTLTANRDSIGVSGILVDSFRSNTTQGQAHHILGFEIKENSVRYSGCRMHWAYDSNANKYNFALCPTKQGSNQPASFSLGMGGYYWDKINECNPGALSLPGSSSGIYTDNWDKTGATVNSYTPAVDGWLVLRCADVAGDYLFATWSGGAMRASVTGQGLITLPAAGLCLYIPVKAGTTVDCVVKVTSNFGAYIYPCLGNV